MTDSNRKPQTVPRHVLLDTIREAFDLSSDGRLAVFLDTQPPTISRIRSGRNKVSAGMVLRIYDKTGWTIEEIRGLVGYKEED